MTTAAPIARVSDPEAVSRALHEAAARATLAPSIHNTQPWRFVVGPNRLDVYADRERSVRAIDPHGRQLAISCGAALFGARIALEVAGLDAVTTLLPDAARPALLASITVSGSMHRPDRSAQRLDAVAATRHSNRRQFAPGLVSAKVLETVTNAATLEGAWLAPIRDLDDRIVVATLTQRAEVIQEADPSYQAELSEWTARPSEGRDGIPPTAVPRETGTAHDDIPLRDFDVHGTGELPGETRSRLTQSMFVLGTAGDSLRDLLKAGQALGRVLLELTSNGYAASILSQVAEVPSTREQLRHELRLNGYLHLLLRAGVAEATPATPRRALSDVVLTIRPL
jgi:hypothetical protein